MQLEYQQEEAVIRRRYRLVLAGMFLAMTVPCIHRWKTYRAVFRFLIEIAGW